MVNNRLELRETVGLAKSSYYHKSKIEKRDEKLKKQIEEVLSEMPSYGHKRIAMKLKRNKKPILRVMNKFGIRPYRRKKKPWRKANTGPETVLVNYLKEEKVIYKRSQVWVTDFTYLYFKDKYIYLATVIDRYTREVLGICVLSKHNLSLVLNAFKLALEKNPAPKLIHQDQGSEYTAKEFQDFCISKSILPSYSDKGSPWLRAHLSFRENGHQESFYDKFKTDIGDINRFGTLGELVFAIHNQIYIYNNKRIHTSLKMTPVEFAEKSFSEYTSAI